MANDRPLDTCEVCGARVTELRRGRCWGCYQRWAEERPVGLGAMCIVCGDRRRSHLRLVELLRAWVPMCHNCAAAATRLSPMPDTLEEIRTHLRRERRAAERRAGKPDTRVYLRERRGLERRAVGASRDDDLLILDEEDIQILDEEPAGDPRSPLEETRVHAPPTGRTL